MYSGVPDADMVPVSARVGGGTIVHTSRTVLPKYESDPAGTGGVVTGLLWGP